MGRRLHAADQGQYQGQRGANARAFGGGEGSQPDAPEDEQDQDDDAHGAPECGHQADVLCHGVGSTRLLLRLGAGCDAFADPRRIGLGNPEDVGDVERHHDKAGNDAGN